MTAVVCTVTAVVSVVALLDPTVSGLLLRDEPLVAAGQWWRLVTPMLVQPEGWGQFAFNLAGVAVVGAAVERRRASTTWWMAYLAAGVGAIVVVTVLRPGDVGGGSSDCVAGLIGALAITEVRRGPSTTVLAVAASAYGAFFCAYLAALDLAGPWPASIVGDLAVAAFLAVRRHPGATRAAQGLLALIVVTGAFMALRVDSHGIGLLVGVIVAMAAHRVDPRSGD